MQFKDTQSIYLQIADLMMDHILEGRWGDSERIPSIRESAVQLEVNPNTVTRFYNYLQDLGIIFNRRGIGYFTADDALHQVKQLKRQQFIQHTLPEVFRSMKLLDIEIGELEKLFNASETDKQRSSSEE